MARMVTRVIGVAMVAAAMVGLAAAAHADATQPTVARPEVAQFQVDRPVAGECETVAVRVGSDEGVFGSSGADGVR